MSTLRPRTIILTALLLVVLLLTGCTRSASTPPPAEEEGAPTGSQSETQATMDAVRSAILTQTAQALEGGAATATATPEPTTESAATATPAEAEETSTDEVQSDFIEYTVQPGDWIFKIARDYGIDPQAIIDANDLAAPNALEVGMVLKIPVSGEAPSEETEEAAEDDATTVAGGTTHVVKPGEWIWQIARLYGVDPQEIIDANNLTSPATIYPGQELIIP
ncbi:MAG: LysM domain-containing protein [Anaerolineales bacterium]|nr:LysM domain-containing protein [Anaerolineales bacterium]